MLPQRGFTATAGYPRLSLWDDLTQRAAAGTILYLVLLALLSAGVALLVRDTGGAIVLILSLLFLSPVFSMFITNPPLANSPASVVAHGCRARDPVDA